MNRPAQVRSTRLSFVGVLLLLAFVLRATASDGVTEGSPQPRRPVALAFAEDGRTLFCVNEASGTVAAIDAREGNLVNEWTVGGRPSDLAVAGNVLIVSDAQRHQLLTIPSKPGKILSVDVPRYPQRVVVSSDGRTLFVTSLWSRRVSRFDVANDGKLAATGSVALPFEPREIIFTPDEDRLIVASAFSAKLAVLSREGFTIERFMDLNGHNIRGLGFRQEVLLVTLQHLNPVAHSTQDDIHWGNMMSNLLVELPLAGLLSDQAVHRIRIDHQLGEPGAGAGDPGALLVHDDHALVLLSGVSAFGQWSFQSQSFDSMPVGRHPVAIATQGDVLAVANRLDDSITLFYRKASDDWTAAKVREVSFAPSRELTSIERGEQLFYDSRLSHDGWLSCHSCHSEGHSNGQLNDNLSDGGFGAAKRVPSLLGVGDTQPWSWLGKVASLEEQVRNSIDSTMRGQPIAEQEVADLVAYMRSLNLPVDEQDPHDAVAREAGKAIFLANDCNRCHAGTAFTTEGIYDVGIVDEVGNAEFNPPSLRGLRWRENLLHDGRAKSLRELFGQYQHQLKSPLKDAEVEALVAYLESLG